MGRQTSLAPPKESEAAARVSRPYFFRYLSDKGIKNLPSYKYHGSDASYLYQHIISPSLNTLVERGYVPRWLHPNVITLTALAFMVVSHCITAYYCPTFKETDAPSWVFVLNAVSMVVYWVLDALDGKQARRLGLSSPLGLLVDHGCDALNTTIGMMNLTAMLGVGPGMKSFVLWASASSVFFAATWEEYYVGSLNLPMINGPNEGVLLGACFHMWTAYAGISWWSTYTGMGVRRNSVLIIVLVTMSVLTMVSNTYNVVTAVRAMKRGDGDYTATQVQAGTQGIAFSRFIPFFMMLVVSGSWAAFSPTDVMSRHPRVYIWVLGLMLCKLVMTMMVAHLSDDQYHPFGKTLAGILALGAHLFLTAYFVGVSQPWEDLILFELTAVVLVSYLHMVLSLAWEISTLLNITILTVPAESKVE